MAKHPYLNFSNSEYTNGKVIGTSKYIADGNGLTNKNIKIIQIPPVFDDDIIVEVGWKAFRFTQITSVFISKNIRYINWGAFESTPLVDVRFEKGSKLERVDSAAFYNCLSLTRIDFPSSLNEMLYTDYLIFYKNIKLSCVSYLGVSDFSTIKMFDNTPKIHVSSSYNYEKFGELDVSKDDQTCGTSNERFYPTRRMCCSLKIRYQCRSNHFLFVVILLRS